ncbi:MAG: hypothetical protein Q8P41_05140 [Pseudomonadota bacterium]|nr:hypothetical protein [Pseudomonadota bacterium]
MLRRVLVTFVFAQAFASAVAWACSCAGSDHSDDDAIFIGVPHATVRGCGGDMFSDHVTKFTVMDACRGDLGETVQVQHGISGASCGVEFEPDVVTIVFATENEDGQLQTNLCMGNTPVSEPECEANGF